MIDKEYFEWIALTVYVCDTSDFEDDEIRSIPYLNNLSEWDKKIIKTNPCFGSYGLNKKKELFIHHMDKSWTHL
jgi:hypothetical protein